MIAELNLQNVDFLTGPIAKVDDGKPADKLDEVSTAKCKSPVARANRLAADRLAIQFTCEELSPAMASPSTTDHEKLERMVRYLVGTLRVAHVYRGQRSLDHFVAHADAGSAGDRAARKSTSGGLMTMGSH